MANVADPKGPLASDDKALSDSDRDKQHDVNSGTPPAGDVQDELTYQFDNSRRLGMTSSAFVIFNKMVGTGIFSTPSGVFAASGSVGVSLFLWIIGGILTFAGLSAFMEFGLAVSSNASEACHG